MGPCIYAPKAWEDSHGVEEKIMKQAMYLPHLILGSLCAAGKSELVAGREVSCLKTSATSTRCVFQKPKPKIENNTADHLVRCCPSEALSNCWKTLAHTSWFKRHPILSATSRTKLLFLGVWNDDENDDEHYGKHDGK